MAHRIAVIGGDGIGPEVTAEAVKVVGAAGVDVDTTDFDLGGDRYLRDGEILSDTTLAELRRFDAILLGAVGTPDVPPGVIERGLLLKMRFELDLYVNLRPIKLYAEHLCPLKGVQPEQLDFFVVRENTEGAYVGLGGLMKKGTPDEVAVCDMVWTRNGTERVIRYAYELAQRRARAKRVTLVDKANAIRPMDLWTRTFEEVGKEFPEIEQDHAYVDAACMWMVKTPNWFDVVVTSNLFGDIITDLGAMLQGGLGIAASGNLHPGRVSMFEPIHGSAPKYKGKNVACPVACVMAVQMLLDYLGDSDGAALVENAIANALRTKKIPSLHAGAIPTDRAGDVLVEEIKAQATAAG
jgi:3-isopropylmalate dehydrogenase